MRLFKHKEPATPNPDSVDFCKICGAMVTKRYRNLHVSWHQTYLLDGRDGWGNNLEYESFFKYPDLEDVKR